MLSSTQELIEHVKKHVGNLGHIERWRCFAYDARYAGKAELSVHPAERASRKRLHALLHNAGFTLRYGSYVVRDMKVVGNVSSLKVIVQKGVDTMIVVDAMREAIKVGTETLIFITGDSDFIPLFLELRNLRRRVILLHGDMTTVSARLAKVSSSAHQIVRTAGRASEQRQLGGMTAWVCQQR